MNSGKLKPKDEECIRKNYIFIKDNIDASKLIDFLYQNEILTVNDKEDIESEKTTSSKNENLLRKILRAGPYLGFKIFLSALDKYYPTVHKHLIDWIQSNCTTDETQLNTHSQSSDLKDGNESKSIETDCCTESPKSVLEILDLLKITDDEIKKLSIEKLKLYVTEYREKLINLRSDDEKQNSENFFQMLRLICFNENTLPALESQTTDMIFINYLKDRVIDLIKEQITIRNREKGSIPIYLLVMALEAIYSSNFPLTKKRESVTLSANHSFIEVEKKVFEVFITLMTESINPTIKQNEKEYIQKTFFIIIFLCIKDMTMFETKRTLNKVHLILKENSNSNSKEIKVIASFLHQLIQEGDNEFSGEVVHLSVQWIREAVGRQKFRADNGLDGCLLLSGLEILTYNNFSIMGCFSMAERRNFIDLIVKLLNIKSSSHGMKKFSKIRMSTIMIAYNIAVMRNYEWGKNYKDLLMVVNLCTEDRNLTVQVIATLTKAFLCQAASRYSEKVNDDVLAKITEWLKGALKHPKKKNERGFYAKHLLQAMMKFIEHPDNYTKISSILMNLRGEIESQDDIRIKDLFSNIYQSSSLNKHSPITASYHPMDISNDEHKSIDILLIGKTGNGKSATGNTILGREVFEEGDGDESVTCDVQHEYTEFDGRRIKVVDCPGVEDTDNINDIEKATVNVIEKMEDAVLEHPKGYHAFLLVVKYGGRFTNEDRRVVAMLKSIFGANIVKDYCILLMTHGDNYRAKKENKSKEFNQWCNEQRGLFYELLQECGRRAVLFDNITEDTLVRDRQMMNLIKEIDNLQYSGRRYCDFHFKAAEERRRRLLLETKEPKITEGIRRKCSLLIRKSISIASYEPEDQIEKLQDLITEVKQLEVEVLQQDNGTGILNSSISTSSHLLATIENQLNIQKTQKEKLLIEKKKEEMLNTYSERMNEYKEKIKMNAQEDSNYRLMIKEIDEKFAEDKQQIDALEEKIQNMEEELKKQLVLYENNLKETENKYEEMIKDLILENHTLKTKYDSFPKRLKNLCRPQ